MKIRSLTLACTEVDLGRLPHAPFPEIAVSGRSNVGKSSLLNTILGRKNIARTSKEPGKTRTINFFLVNDRFYLVDLPGYGYAKVSAEMRKNWKRLILEYFETRESVGGVVQLVDSRHPPMKDDLMMMGKLIEKSRPFVVALTKADKVPRGQRQKTLKILREHLGGVELRLLADRRPETGSAGPETESGLPVLFFSAKTGEGKAALWRWIASSVGIG
ncbi:MAG: YihA family ribosome biogenesis GTP-binding protein [Candidatus Krumholzibacteria bacterium]|nr:YihA family ribosome biogenesis GTP-binding protein [Candidatus Krumholzibacteria bacterium]